MKETDRYLTTIQSLLDRFSSLARVTDAILTRLLPESVALAGCSGGYCKTCKECTCIPAGTVVHLRCRDNLCECCPTGYGTVVCTVYSYGVWRTVGLCPG